MPALRLLALYLALASALLAWKYAAPVRERLGERPWRDTDEVAVLEIAKSWQAGSGAAGLWETAVSGIRAQKQVRPLHWTAWALLYRAFGDDRRPYYALGFALHLLSGWLVLLLVRAWCAPSAWIGPLLGALFFESHELHRLTLLWLAAQQDLLHAPFYLGALVCLARWLGGRAVRLYWIAVALAFLGIAGKEFIATLGPVALAWIALASRTPVDFLRRAPRALPFIVVTVATLLLRASVPHGYAVASPQTEAKAAETLRELYDPEWGIADPALLARNWFARAPWRILSNDGSALVFAGVLILTANGVRRARSVRVPAMALSAALLYFLPVLSTLAKPAAGNQDHWFYAPVLFGAVVVGWGIAARAPSASE